MAVASSDGIQPNFFQKHRNTILAISALTLAVSVFAVGYFAAQGSAAFLTPGIPISLIATGATAFFITTLLKNPPSKIQKAQTSTPARCTRRHVDELTDYPCRRNHVPLSRSSSTSNLSNTEDEFKDALSTQPNGLEESKNEKAYLSLDQVQSEAQVVRSLCNDVLTPLFSMGKKLFTGVIQLYAHTYSKNEQTRIDTINHLVDEWSQTLQDNLQQPDNFLWMGLDSAFALLDDVECDQYRTGQKSGDAITALLKRHACELGNDARLSTVIDAWITKPEIDLGQTLNLTTLEGRAPFVKAYQEMDALPKAQLTWLFGLIMRERLDKDLLNRWSDICQELNNEQSPEAQTLRKANCMHLLKYDMNLNEAFVGLGGKFMASQIHEKVSGPLKNTPLEIYVPLLEQLTNQMLLPLICAKCPNSQFHPVLLAVTKDEKLIEAHRKNLMSFAEELQRAVQSRLA